MKRADKIAGRIARAKAHSATRKAKYIQKIIYARRVDGYRVPLYAASEFGFSGSWRDENSPTGYSQVCSYKGICQSPCNGDC